jgi:hypothetical protein
MTIREKLTRQKRLADIVSIAEVFASRLAPLGISRVCLQRPPRLRLGSRLPLVRLKLVRCPHLTRSHPRRFTFYVA